MNNTKNNTKIRHDLTVTKAITAVTSYLILLIGISGLFTFPLMWLWNYVMPYQFGAKEIDFFHMWALAIVCNMLFKTQNFKLNLKNNPSQ